MSEGNTIYRGRPFKLGSRLKACADMVDYGMRVVDVGSDHAYLPVWLAIHGRIPYGIACDINRGPLNSAIKNIKKYNAEGVVNARISDGLENISSNEVDCIIISGMGGRLISDIISKCSWPDMHLKKLILQPMTSEYELRIFLISNGYRIKKELAVASMGRTYAVMLVVYTGTNQKYKDEYPYIGEISSNMNKDSANYIKRQIRDLENRRQGAAARGNFEEERKLIRIINSIHSKY